MPYGTEPFTDGYGDYKQPTIIDYDDKSSIISSSSNISPEERQKIIDQFKIDQENVLSEILSTNPAYGGTEYNHLTSAVNGKLIWDRAKIDALKADTTWLYNLLRFLRKKKKLNISH